MPNISLSQYLWPQLFCMTRSAWTWAAFGFANRSSGPCFGCICWLPRLVMTWLWVFVISVRLGLVWSGLVVIFNCLSTWRRPELRIFAPYCICRNYARKGNTRQSKQQNATWWLIVESCTPSGLFVISRRWNYKLFWLQPHKKGQREGQGERERRRKQPKLYPTSRRSFFGHLFRCEKVHKGLKHEYR